jgi:hypothetical protein
MKKPSEYLDTPMRFRADAQLADGGVLLTSDRCKFPVVSLHFMKDFEKNTSSKVMASFERLERKQREWAEQNNAEKAELDHVKIEVEGSLEKNPDYRMVRDRGPATLKAWDYHQEYAFVVTRIISIGRSARQ